MEDVIIAHRKGFSHIIKKLDVSNVLQIITVKLVRMNQVVIVVMKNIIWNIINVFIAIKIVQHVEVQKRHFAIHVL